MKSNKKKEMKLSGLVSAVSASAIIIASGFGLVLGAKMGDSYAHSYSDITAAMDGYKDILRTHGEDMRKGIGSFMVADLNSDGMPEMIYDQDSTPVSIDDIYTYSDGKVVKLDTSKMNVYVYGSYKISSERKSFCIFRGGPATTDGMPYDYHEFEIKGNAIVEKDDYYGVDRDGSWRCSDKNGEISYETFKSVADSFSSIKIHQNNESNRVVFCNPDAFISETYTWKSDANGWWFGDENGNFLSDKWIEIEEKWYYFKSNGYMAASEWVDGWWCNSDGSCTYGGVGLWKSDASGWWYSDTSGWYPTSQWQKIDGSWYYFEASGYIATNKYIDGWWCGADGVCN